MFKKLTETLLKVVDDQGDLVSLNSVLESTRMDILSIVKIVRSKKLLFFPKEVYRPTTVKLENLLNMDTVDQGGYKTHNIAAVDLSQQVQANCGMKLLVPSVGETEVSSEAESTLSTTEIKLQYVSAGLDYLNRLIQKSSIDEDHLLIQEMKKSKSIVGLGVVYEVMRNENPMTLEQASKGSACAKLPASNIASVEASAGASSTQRLKLEAGCVLGFKVFRLSLVSGPKKINSDQKRGGNRGPKKKGVPKGVKLRDGLGTCQGESFLAAKNIGDWTPIPQVHELSESHGGMKIPSFGSIPGDWTPIPQVHELSESHGGMKIPSFGSIPDIGENEADFPSLKRRVEMELHDFQEMDQSMKKLIRGPLNETLKCPEALYALNCMLEEGCVSTGGSSLLEMSDDVRLKVDNLLKVMGLDSADSSDPPKLLHPLGLLVGSLSELDQDSLTLILDLDGEDRGQVLKMMESVLEQVYSMDGGAPQLSGQFSEKAIGLAAQVMNSCGLYLDENGLDPSLGSCKAPSEALKGFYATFKGLDMLLGP